MRHHERIRKALQQFSEPTRLDAVHIDALIHWAGLVPRPHRESHRSADMGLAKCHWPIQTILRRNNARTARRSSLEGASRCSSQPLNLNKHLTSTSKRDVRVAQRIQHTPTKESFYSLKAKRLPRLLQVSCKFSYTATVS